MTRSIVRPMEMVTVGRCFPSGPRGEPVAGDFFDVLELDDCRTLIAVGDVVGHGVEVAARMEVLRDTNRVLALEGLSVVEVVHQLDVLQCGYGLEELATLWLGIYDSSNNWLEYAGAGHPPPVLAGVDGGVRMLSEASAPPLGSGHVERHVLIDRVRLTAGALLVAYSDGLIERADLDIEDQMEMLRALVADVYVPALSHAALEHLVERVLRRVPRSPESAPDDVCILAVHWPDLPTQ